MKTMAKRIKINTASVEDLLSLYDIGEVLAQRIIHYREQNGYFLSADDLAKVKGVKIELAEILSANIDWQIPAQETTTVPREISTAMLSLIVAGALVFQAAKKLIPNIQQILAHTEDINWVAIWINFSLLAFFIVQVVVQLLWVVTYSTTRKGLKQKADLLATRVLFLQIITILSLALANSIYYQFYAPNRWYSLMSNYGALIAILGVIFAGLFYMPYIVLLWNPYLLTSPKLHRIHDFGIILGSPLYAFGIWILRTTAQWWELLLYAFIGIMLLLGGAYILRTGKSLFQQTVEFVDESSITSRADSLNFWRTWINQKLPNSQDQIQLKQALDEMYKPSPIRTVSGVIIVGAGGWLLLTVIDAVIQWFIQNWLSSLF